MHELTLHFNRYKYSISYVVGRYTEDAVGEIILDISIDSPDEYWHLIVNTVDKIVTNVDRLCEAELLFTDIDEFIKINLLGVIFVYVRPFRFNNLRLLWDMHNSIMIMLIVVENGRKFEVLAYKTSSSLISYALPEKELIRNGEFKF